MKKKFKFLCLLMSISFIFVLSACSINKNNQNMSTTNINSNQNQNYVGFAVYCVTPTNADEDVSLLLNDSGLISQHINGQYYSDNNFFLFTFTNNFIAENLEDSFNSNTNINYLASVDKLILKFEIIFETTNVKFIAISKNSYGKFAFKVLSSSALTNDYCKYEINDKFNNFSAVEIECYKDLSTQNQY